MIVRPPFGRTLEAPIPKKSGLVGISGIFSKAFILFVLPRTLELQKHRNTTEPTACSRRPEGLGSPDRLFILHYT